MKNVTRKELDNLMKMVNKARKAQGKPAWFLHEHYNGLRVMMNVENQPTVSITHSYEKSNYVTGQFLTGVLYGLNGSDSDVQS